MTGDYICTFDWARQCKTTRTMMMTQHGWWLHGLERIFFGFLPEMFWTMMMTRVWLTGVVITWRSGPGAFSRLAQILVYTLVWYSHAKLERVMVFYGIVGHGVVWYGVATNGMVWLGRVWCGVVWYGKVRYVFIWYGMMCYVKLFYGMVYYSMVWLAFSRAGEQEG